MFSETKIVLGESAPKDQGAAVYEQKFSAHSLLNEVVTNMLLKQEQGCDEMPLRQERIYSKSSMEADMQHQWDKIWRHQRRQWLMLSVGRAFYNNVFLAVLRPYLKPESTLLEVGCGTASLGLKLAPLLREYIGIDISEEAVGTAMSQCKKRQISNMRFIRGDVLTVTVPERVDVVWSQGFLEHFEDDRAMLRAHIKFCKNGGVIILSVPRKDSYLHYWYRFSRLSRLRFLWPWSEQKFYSEELLETLVCSVPDTQDYAIYPFPFWGLLIAKFRVHCRNSSNPITPITARQTKQGVEQRMNNF